MAAASFARRAGHSTSSTPARANKRSAALPTPTPATPTPSHARPSQTVAANATAANAPMQQQQQQDQHAARVAALCALPFPSHPPLTAGEPGSFAQDTVTRRLPLIVEGVLADLRQELAGPRQQGADRAAGEAAERALAQLRDDMAAGAPLAPAHHPLRMPGEAAVPPTAGAAVVAASSTDNNDDDARFAVACRADAAALGLPGARGSPREALAYCLDWTNAGIDAAARVGRPGVVAAAAAAGGDDAPPPPTWVDMPWLAVECYLYARLLAGALWSDAAAAAGLAGPAPASAPQTSSSPQQPQPQQPYYDPFARQKAAALVGSAPAAEEIGRATLELLAKLEEGAEERRQKQQQQQGSAAAALAPPPPASDDATARAALHALCQYALWGNKTDLSLSAGSAAALSNGGSAVLEATAAAAATGGQASTSSPLLRDDFEALWRAVSSSSSSSSARTVHLVLDNAALELFSDLCLADGLLASGCASVVVLHGKPLPWFVSDALAAGDLGALLWPSEGGGDGNNSSSNNSSSSGRALAARWREYAASGRLLWAEHPFWTTPLPFWWMGAAAPALERALFGGGGEGEGGSGGAGADDATAAVPLASLPPSRAVIFKGDLNYRKLTADCRWPWTTPFGEALGPLGQQGAAASSSSSTTRRRPVALVTLRTLKADVIAGLDPGVGEAAAARDKDWQVNGRFGVVQAAEL